MQQINSMQDLMGITISDLVMLERRQLDTLPRIESAARTPALKQAIRQHQEETHAHIDKLEQVARKFGPLPMETPNAVLDAMVQHAQEMIEAGGTPEVKEAALICEAQKFEHMEMAAYGTAAAFCKQLGDDESAGMFREILEEEKRSDERLSSIAETRSNPKAAERG